MTFELIDFQWSMSVDLNTTLDTVDNSCMSVGAVSSILIIPIILNMSRFFLAISHKTNCLRNCDYVTIWTIITFNLLVRSEMTRWPGFIALHSKVWV